MSDFASRIKLGVTVNNNIEVSHRTLAKECGHFQHKGDGREIKRIFKVF